MERQHGTLPNRVGRSKRKILKAIMMMKKEKEEIIGINCWRGNVVRERERERMHLSLYVCLPHAPVL